MAVPGLSQAASTAIANYSKELADNVSNNTALLRILKEKGNIRLVDGGLSILQEIDFTDNTTFKFYSGGETFDLTPQEVISAFQYEWKQAAVTVQQTGLEEIRNAGRSRMIDLFAGKLKNAGRSMSNAISTGVYSDGTAYSGKTIGGLQLLLADSPSTGTVGGVDRATWSFARNVVFDATSDGGAATTASNIVTYMNKTYNQVVRGTDYPDLIVFDNNYFSLFEAYVQGLQRIVDETQLAKVGFPSYRYKRSQVVLDGGNGGDCPANHGYFINTDYLSFVTYRERNMVELPMRDSFNQDSWVKYIVWAGNLCCSNFQLQATMKE